MVCFIGRSGAVVPVLVLLFVALWFILWGDLLCVFPCVILFLCFSVLLVLRLPRLGKRELILVLFVRLFGLCLFRFVGFLFLLGFGKGCGLWLWHSLDFSLTFFSTWFGIKWCCVKRTSAQPYTYLFNTCKCLQTSIPWKPVFLNYIYTHNVFQHWITRLYHETLKVYIYNGSLMNKQYCRVQFSNLLPTHKSLYASK